MPSIKGSFQLSSWDENAYDERDGHRLTRASVSQRFEGDIAGDGAAEWLMAYQADGSARFVGFQVVAGEVAGRHGTLVLETAGEFDGRVARWDATVVPGSSTGELKDAKGAGKFEAPHGSTAAYELEISLSDR
ncbi:MAG TPA: DUF3224 domain-containing protein [Solirubrobacteraceae bacterium]|jgi:hypothetical protein